MPEFVRGIVFHCSTAYPLILGVYSATYLLQRVVPMSNDGSVLGYGRKSLRNLRENEALTNVKSLQSNWNLRLMCGIEN